MSDSSLHLQNFSTIPKFLSKQTFQYGPSLLGTYQTHQYLQSRTVTHAFRPCDYAFTVIAQPPRNRDLLSLLLSQYPIEGQKTDTTKSRDKGYRSILQNASSRPTLVSFPFCESTHHNCYFIFSRANS